MLAPPPPPPNTTSTPHLLISLRGAWRCYHYSFFTFDEDVPAASSSRSCIAFDEDVPAASSSRSCIAFDEDVPAASSSCLPVAFDGGVPAASSSTYGNYVKPSKTGHSLIGSTHPARALPVTGDFLWAPFLCCWGCWVAIVGGGGM